MIRTVLPERCVCAKMTPQDFRYRISVEEVESFLASCVTRKTKTTGRSHPEMK
jgi:hypothetical protein